MSRSLIAYAVDQKNPREIREEQIEIQQANSEKRAKLSVLADILSYYAWMNRPDRYDSEKVGDTVLKLIKSQGMGVGGDAQMFLDARVKGRMESLRSGFGSDPLFNVLEECRSEYLGNSVKGPILAVSVDMDPFRGLTDAFLEDPRIHARRTVLHSRTTVLVPLFRMVSWISEQVIDCPHFANLMGRARSAGRTVATRIRGSGEYAGRLSKIFFSLICIVNGSDLDPSGRMKLRFDTKSIQDLLPCRLFAADPCNYNLLFIGDEDLKSDAIDAFLSRMHADATVAGSRKSMGNSSYRRFRVMGDQTFEIYDVHETRCSARFMCTMDSISSRMAPGGYIAVICSDDPERTLRIADTFGYDGAEPAATLVMGATGPADCPLIPRSDEGLEALERVRIYGVGSSAENGEFADYFFFSILEALGVSKDEVDALEPASSSQGIESVMAALIDASDSLKEITLGMAVILASAFSALRDQGDSRGMAGPCFGEESDFMKTLLGIKTRSSEGSFRF